MQKIFSLCLLTLMTLSVGVGRAQTPVCSNATSVDDCFDEGYKALATSRNAEISNAAENQVKTAETTTVVAAGDEGSSLTDFLSPFLALVDSGDLSGDGQRIGIELAAKLLDDLDRDVKVQVVFNEAKLFSPFKMQLNSDMMAERATVLEESLGDTADWTATASWTPINKKYGRSFEHHRSWIRGFFDDAAQQAVQSDAGAKQEATLKLFIQLSRCVDPNDSSKIDLACLNDDEKQAVFDAGRNLAGFNQEYKAAIENHQLFKIGKLLNNQPQFIVSLAHTTREQLAGADETNFSIQYEKGIVNLNSLHAECKDAASPLKCFSKYIGDREEAIGANNRVSLKLVYNEIDDVRIDIPADMTAMTSALQFAHPGSSSISLTGSYGRYLWIASETSSARIDVSVMGEWFDNDTPSDSSMMTMADAMERQDRLVASFTYTQKLSDQLGAVLGFSYANEPEFLGEVTEKLSARAGLTYRITGLKK